MKRFFGKVRATTWPALFMLMYCTSLAHGADFSGTFSGQFLRPQPSCPPRICSGMGSPSIAWGTPISGSAQSSLDYVGQFASGSFGKPVVVGIFTYHNGQTLLNSHIDYVDFISKGILNVPKIGSGIAVQAPARLIQIVNTPNSSDAAASADIVRIPRGPDFHIYENSTAKAELLGIVRRSGPSSVTLDVEIVGIGKIIGGGGFTSEPNRVDLFAVADTQISEQSNLRNYNFGARTGLGLTAAKTADINRILLKFDDLEVAHFLSKNKLRQAVVKMTLSTPVSIIGGTSQKVAIYPLPQDFVEGNATTQGSRGSGEGATWNCAVDRNIKDNLAKCRVKWTAASFAQPATSAVVHTASSKGEIQFDVTRDLAAGVRSWMIRPMATAPKVSGEYYSREGALAAAIPAAAPHLTLVGTTAPLLAKSDAAPDAAGETTY